MLPTEEAGLLTDLTISQPRAVAMYGLCGPAQAKRINYLRTQTHTYCNKWPLGPRGSLLPVNLSVNAVGVPPTAPV